jgi:hypothetical protein
MRPAHTSTERSGTKELRRGHDGARPAALRRRHGAPTARRWSPRGGSSSTLPFRAPSFPGSGFGLPPRIRTRLPPRAPSFDRSGAYGRRRFPGAGAGGSVCRIWAAPWRRRPRPGASAAGSRRWRSCCSSAAARRAPRSRAVRAELPVAAVRGDLLYVSDPCEHSVAPLTTTWAPT